MDTWNETQRTMSLVTRADTQTYTQNNSYFINLDAYEVYTNLLQIVHQVYFTDWEPVMRIFF